jgi:hypothetical protein
MYKDLTRRRITHAKTEKRLVLRNRTFIREFKAGKPCVDCRLVWPHYVMDFDHLRDKVNTVSVIGKKGSLSRIQTEIDKCELVCSNCHRIRTYGRRGLETGVPL